jgi:hypothetical protein
MLRLETLVIEPASDLPQNFVFVGIPPIAASSRPILPQLGFPDKHEPLPLGCDAWEHHRHRQAPENAGFTVIRTDLSFAACANS